MAKRRKLEAPSAEDLGRIEAEFQRDTVVRSPAAPAASVAPIAQIAAESAAAYDPRSAGQRVEAARDRQDAEAHRAAQVSQHNHRPERQALNFCAAIVRRGI